MLVVFGCALLVLTAAVVVLFAMLGELVARLPDPQRGPAVLPIEEAAIGRSPDAWPAALPDPQRCVLLVLSTACGSCANIAERLSEEPDWEELGVVVSTAGRHTAEDFIARYGLARFRHYIDESGEWVGDQFQVRISPSALVFHAGRLTSAYTLNDPSGLRTLLTQRTTQPDKEAAV
jgi:hypothetical protein